MQTTKHETAKFRKAFRHGCEFWTSEDGCLHEIVIMEQPDWDKVMQFQFAHRFGVETFDKARGRKCYVEQSWAGMEYFDGGNKKRGKVWWLTDEVTPFPVIAYELKIPR